MDYNELLNIALKAQGVYKAVTELGPKLIKFGKDINKRKYYDIDEIFPCVLEKNLKLGDIVECSGFLTKYSQTFLPMSFESSIPGQASEKVKSFEKVNGKLNQIMEMKVNWTALQAPVNVIPPSGNYMLCFLYPEDFNGFIYPVNDGKDDPILNNKITVPKIGKPIPVIINTTKHLGLVDHFVNLSARVSIIPKEISVNLNHIYNHFLLDYNSNFFNPFAEVSSFICLSLIDDDKTTYVEANNNNNIPNAEAQIFTEFHVEGLDDYPDISTKIVEDSIPDIASNNIKIMTVKGYEVSPYLTTGDIRLLYKKPNIVGLYTTTDLFNRRKYEETIKNMSEYSQKLSRNIQSNSFDAIGKRLKTQTDFVFDPTKALLFDSRGVLNIKDDCIPKENRDSYKDIINWYSNASK